jgi:hypothetical protein
MWRSAADPLRPSQPRIPHKAFALSCETMSTIVAGATVADYDAAVLAALPRPRPLPAFVVRIPQAA